MIPKGPRYIPLYGGHIFHMDFYPKKMVQQILFTIYLLMVEYQQLFRTWQWGWWTHSVFVPQNDIYEHFVMGSAKDQNMPSQGQSTLFWSWIWNLIVFHKVMLLQLFFTTVWCGYCLFLLCVSLFVLFVCVYIHLLICNAHSKMVGKLLSK